jgi:hypothetical protein
MQQWPFSVNKENNNINETENDYNRTMNLFLCEKDASLLDKTIWYAEVVNKFPDRSEFINTSNTNHASNMFSSHRKMQLKI